MVGGSIALTRVVTHIKIHYPAIGPTIVAQEIITGTQNSQRLIVELLIAAALCPGSNLLGKIFQLLARDPGLTQILPGIDDKPASQENNKQDCEAPTFHLIRPLRLHELCCRRGYAITG